MLLAVPPPRASALQLPAPNSDMTGSFAELRTSLARRFVPPSTAGRKRMAAAQTRLSAAHRDVKTLPTSHCIHLKECPPRAAPGRPSRAPKISSACVRALCFCLGQAGLSANRRSQFALTWPSMEGMFYTMGVATGNAAFPTCTPAFRRGRQLDLLSACPGVRALQRWVVES